MQAVRADTVDTPMPVEAAPPPVDRAPAGVDRLGPALAMVEWHDAWFEFDMAGPEDARTDYVVRTVGFLVADGPRFVSLAQEVLPDGDGFRAVTHIPKPVVARLVHLDPGDGFVTA
jgi:hypothetical protein